MTSIPTRIAFASALLILGVRSITVSGYAPGYAVLLLFTGVILGALVVTIIVDVLHLIPDKEDPQ
jgi:hypothetical protein